MIDNTYPARKAVARAAYEMDPGRESVVAVSLGKRMCGMWRGSVGILRAWKHAAA